MDKVYAGIDIGGTKTSVGLFDKNMQKVCTVTTPTQAEKGCVALVDRIRCMMLGLLNQQGLSLDSVLSVGVACPGPLNLELGTIVYIPTMGFCNEPIVKYLQDAFGMPVYLENDANAAALCESLIGQGRGCETVVYITISTGIGCGIVFGGKILDGKAFSAGELGHFKVERGGNPCSCGGYGCLETYASGTSIARIASERSGEDMDTKTVFSLAMQGIEPAASVVREAANYLGYAIGAVYQILDPNIIVLGGSVTKDYNVFKDDLEATAKCYMQPITGRRLHLTVSDFDGEQVMIGAAYYGKMQHEND